ncbi:hypothetical protein DL93DRAFT_1420955 [Clavulina sp. PMI_390]|nr:hypothetical protein DL93DRAFT_1420955 [Clavulina sp. PMI_390]
MGAIFDVTPISSSLEALIASIAWPPLDHTSVFANESQLTKSERILEVEKRIATLEDTLSSLSPLVNMVLDLQSQVQLRKVGLQMALNPISALPDDILVIIFEWARGPVRIAGSWRASMCFSHVSSRWRTVAINCSTLWNELYIKSPSQAPLLKLMGQRSGIKGFNLTLDLGHTASDSRKARETTSYSDQKVEFTTEFAAQISSVQFQTFHTIDCISVSEAAWELLNPSWINITASHKESGPLKETRWLNKSHVLHLADVYISAPMGPLFHVNTFKFSLGDTSMVQRILSHAPMPSLKRLILHHVSCWTPGTQANILALDLLEAIELSNCDDLGEFNFETPNLRSMMVRMGNIDQRAARDVRKLVHRNPQLEHIKLLTRNSESFIRTLGSTPNNGQDIPIFKSAPSLLSLHLWMPPLASLSRRGAPAKIKPQEVAVRLRGTLESYLAPVPLSSHPKDTCQLASLRIPKEFVGDFRSWYESRVESFGIAHNI